MIIEMPRAKQAPVFIGDIGVIVEPRQKYGVPSDVDLSQLTFRQLCNLAVLLGHDIRDIIGVKSCIDHYELYVFLGDRPMPEGYNLFSHCVYCIHCWRLFRLKELPKEE